MKKSLMLFATFVSFIFMMSFVAAQGAGASAGNAVDTALEVVNNFLNPILSWALGDSSAPENLLIKLFVFLILLSLVHVAAARTPGVSESPFAVWIITVAISILATRFLTEDSLIELLWLPTGVLGVTMIALLPLLLFYFFMYGGENEWPPSMRKIGWTLFTVVFFALAFVRWDEFSDANTGFNLAWIYVITAVLSLIAIYYDTHIAAKMALASVRQGGDTGRRAKLAELKDELTAAEGVYANATKGSPAEKQAKKDVRKIEHKILKMQKLLDN